MEKVIRLGEAIKQSDIGFLLANYHSLKAKIFGQIFVEIVVHNLKPSWMIGSKFYAISEYPNSKSFMKKWTDENSHCDPAAHFGKIPISLIALLIKENYEFEIKDQFMHAENRIQLTFVPNKKLLTLEISEKIDNVHFCDIDLVKIQFIKKLIEQDEYDKLLEMDNLEFDYQWINLKSEEHVHEHFYLAAKLSSDLSERGYWLIPKKLYLENYTILELNRSPLRLNTNNKKEAITLIKSGEFLSDDLIDFQLIKWSIIHKAIEKKNKFTISEEMATISYYPSGELKLEFDGLINGFKIWDMPIDNTFDKSIKNAFYEIKDKYFNVTKNDYKEFNNYYDL
jgi:hypothetical protein